MERNPIGRRDVVRAVSATAASPAVLAGTARGERGDGRSTATWMDGARARRTTTPFAQTAVLGAEDAEAGDLFGVSVAVSSDGETALVGANGDEDPNGSFAGSAYVFVRSDGGWTQQAKLVPGDGDESDEFGVSVALSADGETALVGAPFDEDPHGTTGEQFGGAGSAYVFTGSDGDWTQRAKLAAGDGEPLDNFGYSVALADDGTALVGAREGTPSSNFGGPGSAYVFTGSDGNWTQEAKLTADDGDSADSFGSFLDLSRDGETALVGATFDEDPNGASAGSAYVFSGSGGDWTQQAKLVAEEGGAQDRFGAVALAGESALVGAFRNDDYGRKAGAAYLFERGDGGWRQRRQLVSESVGANDQFGYVVGLSDDESTALVSAVPFQASTAEARPGSTYVFRRGDGTTPAGETDAATGTAAGTGAGAATGTETATGTEAGTGTDTETRGTSASEAQTTSGSGPGFGLLPAVTALAVAAYRRYRAGELG